MNALALFTSDNINPKLDYVAYREQSKDRRAADYFAKLDGCKNGLRSWATGSGPTAKEALEDALKNWITEGR